MSDEIRNETAETENNIATEGTQVVQDNSAEVSTVEDAQNENSETSEDSFIFAFRKSKESWLKTKYVPDLNAYGSIDNYISSTLGEVNKRGEDI